MLISLQETVFQTLSLVSKLTKARYIHGHQHGRHGRCGRQLGRQRGKKVGCQILVDFMVVANPASNVSPSIFLINVPNDFPPTLYMTKKFPVKIRVTVHTCNCALYIILHVKLDLGLHKHNIICCYMGKGLTSVPDG